MSSPVELRPEGTDGGCLLGAKHTFGLKAVGEGDQQRLVSVCRACGQPERGQGAWG